MIGCKIKGGLKATKRKISSSSAGGPRDLTVSQLHSKPTSKRTSLGFPSQGTMPRRKSAAAAGVATASTPKGAHKRQLSSNDHGATTPASAAPGSRASKRIKDSEARTPASATPKKSKYFEAPDSEDEDVDEPTSDDDAEVSGYEDEEDDDVEAEASSGEGASEDDFDSEEDAKPARGKAKKKAGGGSTFIGKSSQLWREGVKAGLGPGKQVFIAKPKPRGDGGVKYLPERIHPNTSECKSLPKATNRKLGQAAAKSCSSRIPASQTMSSLSIHAEGLFWSSTLSWPPSANTRSAFPCRPQSQQRSRVVQKYASSAVKMFFRWV